MNTETQHLSIELTVLECKALVDKFVGESYNVNSLNKALHKVSICAIKQIVNMDKINTETVIDPSEQDMCQG